MKLTAQVLAEDVQSRDGVEYVTATCMETGTNPLLQMFDYGLRREEMSHKGKLVGKSVELQIKTIRAIFSGRPQMVGTLLTISK
jgi:uncharacterized protein (UPF0218 family)